MTEDIKSAVEVLKQGGVIVYPTDTVWGLGCDATRDDAVKKIFRIKQRNDEKSLLMLLDNPDKLSRYAEVPDVAWNILEVADKPLTLIYPGARNIAPSLIADDGSIGIRITRDEFCCKLIRGLGKPIVSTSANISGKPFPAGFRQIDSEILRAADYVVTYRQEDNVQNRPSGIIKLGINGEVKVIRE